MYKNIPPGGIWKTVNGAKVYIKDGRVIAGADGKLSDTAQLNFDTNINNFLSNGDTSIISYDPTMTNEATYYNGKIKVGDKFNALTSSEKKHVLRHEFIHGFVDDLPRETVKEFIFLFNDIYKDRQYFESLIGNLAWEKNGQELLTELLNNYASDQTTLKTRYPAAWQTAQDILQDRDFLNGGIFKEVKDKEFKKIALEYGDVGSFLRENAKELKKKGHDFDSSTALYKDAHYVEGTKHYKPLRYEDAESIILNGLSSSLRYNWFKNEESGVKGKIEHFIMHDYELRNAGINVLYHQYVQEFAHDKKIKFDDFLNMEISLYRGGNLHSYIPEDVFVSYSLRKEVAEKFSKRSGENSGGVSEITVRPRDAHVLGMFDVTGETEVFIRRWDDGR